MSLLISGATIIDGVSDRPVDGRSIWIDAERIRAIDRRDALGVPPGAQVIDARGTFVIAGLMNANVHLMGATSLESLARYEGRYEEIILESAQVALRGGVTTVFDTWGPRKPLMSVRDKIAARHVPGSRIFCAGNIIGLDGPFSLDHRAKALGVASGPLAQRINALYVENSGPDLTWMTPDEVAREVRAYIATGIDLVKYAASEHRWLEYEGTASLLFSPAAQAAIVDEAHRAGITAQAHTSAVEALRMAVEAGCDLIQHPNITGPVRIPDATLELVAKRRTGAVVFPFTKRRFDWIMDNSPPFARRHFSTSDENCRGLIRAGATFLVGSDGMILPADDLTDPVRGKLWFAAGEDNLGDLEEGHFAWLKAMGEKGLPALEGLRAASRNIAVAYGKGKDLGTIEEGKMADVLILDRNPLENVENYRSIRTIIAAGAVVDRDALPVHPILTAPASPPDPALASYGRFATSRYPA
jgi:imidazolonepropionase-like amidohydrolase